ncbi:hypothetical protein P4679_25065 [Priestia megaterium]|uniref:hypothetical protein n=1 Tax=Priestia megaterium TaxID=1404 RepID=UPI002E1CB65F|nr:hypothetical protein [Priestia megaterium]
MSFGFSSFVPAPSFIQRIDKTIEPLNYPECPGVYVMVDNDDKVIYTEQAENLRTKIKTYTTSNCGSEVLNEVTEGNVKEIKIFCCQTELDAVILEHYFINSGLYLGRHNNQQTERNKKELFKEKDVGTNGDSEKAKNETSRSIAEEIQRLLDANNTFVSKIIEQQNSFNDHFMNALDRNGKQIESLAECIRVLTDGVKFTNEKTAGKKKIFTS